MNGKDHVAKGLPVLKMYRAFAVLVSENDGINPAIRTDCMGLQYRPGLGAQAVMEALVTDPPAKSASRLLM